MGYLNFFVFNYIILFNPFHVATVGVIGDNVSILGTRKQVCGIQHASLFEYMYTTHPKKKATYLFVFD